MDRPGEQCQHDTDHSHPLRFTVTHFFLLGFRGVIRSDNRKANEAGKMGLTAMALGMPDKMKWTGLTGFLRIYRIREFCREKIL
jgi:hypothetical protein